MCNLWISDFLIFDFLIFKYSNIGVLWSQITIFIIEITLKLLLHTKYGRITLTEAGQWGQVKKKGIYAANWTRDILYEKHPQEMHDHQ